MTSMQIKSFLAAARTGSFAAAAKELYLSPQGLSQHIQSLEKDLNCRLFLRKSDGVHLTAEGQVFLSFATRLRGMYDNTMTAVTERYRNLALSLRIGISEYVDPEGQICGGLAAFAEKHREVDITGRQYASGRILQALSTGEADVMLMTNSQIAFSGDYEIVPFAKEDLRLYVSHVPELPEGFTLADVAALPEDIPHLDASYGPWTPEEWSEISRRMNAQLGLNRKNRITLSNVRSVAATVQSARSTAVSDSRFGYLQESETLRSVPLPSADFSLCCVSNKQNENPLIPALSEFLKKYYAPLQ